MVVVVLVVMGVEGREQAVMVGQRLVVATAAALRPAAASSAH